MNDAQQNEEALIGAVLLDLSALDRISGLTGKQFLDPDLGELWELLKLIREEEGVVDIVLLKPRLKSSGIQINATRLAKLFMLVPSAAHAAFYRENVVEAHHRRTINEWVADATCWLKDPSMTSGEMVTELDSRLTEFQQSSQERTALTIAEAGESLLSELQNRSRGTASAMMGLPSVDRYLGGMMPGEMIVLAARPGCGKTSLAMQAALHNSARGRHVLFVSLEMTITELAARVLVGMTDVPSADIRSGRVTSEQKNAIAGALAELRDDTLRLIDPVSATIQDVRQQARLQHSREGLDLVVIDYLSLIQSGNTRQQRWEQIGETSRAIKRLAKELQVPVLVLQQLNREADEKPPRLSHLRDSGSIEQDADAVLLLHAKKDGQFNMIFAKNRHGQVGLLELTFNRSQTKFLDGESSE